ncbi:LL-diaminopimelate aminotransferase [Lentibacillus sp. JNUCC-1]|uniref:aminotransferase class I/II-fold pyridoxal phosphate-dependent enzyme n=1 Tax=Lentibacillus sp. JNUCC-1 TaxID=2654513 RepID=UPI0012E8B51E|nr:aminotransferase class I/II-fold pyridoxal phosphate-dependent enzyme [Lentibacillus sp. JNUCC-1]MUV38653.1 LL-diaminopimelate aminotransferase [Lentibacillus sp. JNUCC-1]
MALVSRRVKHLPPYLFSKFQKRKESLQAKGVDVIDLGIGAPDLPTPQFVVDELIKEVGNSANHRYSTYHGDAVFREAVAEFYSRQYGVELDPEKEILALIGSKEGIAHLLQAVIDPGDRVLVPDPGYPVYRTGVQLAGGKVVDLPLDSKAGYVPSYDQVSLVDAEHAKLMLLNYPGNPTAATVNLSTFVEAVAFARRHRLMIAHDAAYDLVTFGDYTAPSLMQVEGAKDVAVEFGSLSKGFGMTGWRIGYVVGNPTLISALTRLKSNIDTCQFLPIQKAAAKALTSDLSEVKAHNAIYEERMEVLHQALTQLGLQAEKPKGTIFIWCKVPQSFSSIDFADYLLETAGVIVTPGTAFGPSGEGYVRISLSVDKDRLKEVADRLAQLDFNKGGSN